MGRNLLNRSFENLGLDQKIWLSQETGGFGDGASGGLIPQAAGAVENIAALAGFTIPREASASRSGRSTTVMLSGKKEVEFSLESYIIPGTPDGVGNPTLPPLHPIFLSLFGSVDLTDPAKILYKLSSVQNSFRMIEEGTHYSKLAQGLVGEAGTFSLPGDGKATLTLEGFGQDVFYAGESLMAQATTGADQTALLVVQDLTYTAVATDSLGNLVSIEYTGGATAGSEVVTVVGNAISVQIEDGVSIATEVETAVNGSAPALVLITVAVTGVGGDSQDVASAVNLAGGLGDDEILVTTGEGEKYEVGALVGTYDGTDGDTNIQNELEIIAKGAVGSANADIIQLDAVVLAAAIGTIVIGHAPDVFAPVSSEFALLGLKGSVTFDGFLAATDCEILNAEISITNNYTQKNFVYGTSKICGFIPDKRREVGVKIDIVLDRDNFKLFMQTKRIRTQDLTLTLEPQDIPAPSFPSGTTGRTFTFRAPKVEFDIPNLEQPADAFITLTLEGKALAPSASQLDEELTMEIS